MPLVDAITPPAAGTRYRNVLLCALPPAELALVESALEPVTLKHRELLYDVDTRMEHVYFVEHGMVSILSVLLDASGVETATIGRDGMIGLPLFHGVDAPAEQAMVQVPGDGHRMTAAAFRTLVPQLPTLQHYLHRFAATLFTLAAQNSACNRKHSVEQRCARWLLTVHDQMDGDRIGLTHDFVSQMLGVRRASVSETLAVLERRQLISVGRSNITIVDRAGLDGMVCECYRIVRSFMRRTLLDEAEASPLASVETSRDGVSTVGDGTPIARSLDDPTTDAR